MLIKLGVKGFDLNKGEFESSTLLTTYLGSSRSGLQHLTRCSFKPFSRVPFLLLLLLRLITSPFHNFYSLIKIPIEFADPSMFSVPYPVMGDGSSSTFFGARTSRRVPSHPLRLLGFRLLLSSRKGWCPPLPSRLIQFLMGILKYKEVKRFCEWGLTTLRTRHSHTSKGLFWLLPLTWNL